MSNDFLLFKNIPGSDNPNVVKRQRERQAAALKDLNSPTSMLEALENRRVHRQSKPNRPFTGYLSSLESAYGPRPKNNSLDIEVKSVPANRHIEIKEDPIKKATSNSLAARMYEKASAPPRIDRRSSPVNRREADDYTAKLNQQTGAYKGPRYEDRQAHNRGGKIQGWREPNGRKKPI